MGGYAARRRKRRMAEARRAARAPARDPKAVPGDGKRVDGARRGAILRADPVPAPAGDLCPCGCGEVIVLDDDLK